MLQTFLNRYSVSCLYYMAAIDNIPSILASGILSKNRLGVRPYRDIANSSVQLHRGHRSVRIDNGEETIIDLHDFVPLYFATHTPMQYVNTQGTKYQLPRMKQEELVFIEVAALKVFKIAGVLFTNGNAAKFETQFFSSPTNLDKLAWHIIRTYNCFSEEYKWKKAAEVLVPRKIPTRMFKRIVIYSRDARSRLEARAEKALPCECSVDQRLYY